MATTSRTPIVLPADPTAALHAAPRQYVDARAAIAKDWPALAGETRSTGFPGIVKANGTNLPVPGYAFDAATEEAVFFRFRADRYTSGDVSVDLDWYADTASTGAVVWGAQLAAVTANTDSQDVETDGLATQATTTTTHLGTVGQRLHRTTVTITAVDSLAADDRVVLRVARVAANAADTLAGDAVLTDVTVRYS